MVETGSEGGSGGDASCFARNFWIISSPFLRLEDTSLRDIISCKTFVLRSRARIWARRKVLPHPFNVVSVETGGRVLRFRRRKLRLVGQSSTNDVAVNGVCDDTENTSLKPYVKTNERYRCRCNRVYHGRVSYSRFSHMAYEESAAMCNVSREIIIISLIP